MRYAAWVAALLFAGCGEGGGDGNFVPIADGDKEMNAAMERARGTLDDFIAAFQKPGPGQSDFGLKGRFTEGDKVEHIWIDELRYEDGKFRGKIGNDVQLLSNLRLGSPCEIGRDQVSDWQYVENGRLVGGYTVRVIFDRMPPDKRRAMQESLPFRLD